MAQMTRRNFLKKTSAGAAAAGALAAVPGAALAAEHVTAAHPDTGEAEPFAVYVRNPAAGELSLLVGEQEFTQIDRDLVARLRRVRKGRPTASGHAPRPVVR